MPYRLYWGDLHSHCSLSYGHGTAEQALRRARQQLDFCSITGHAFWPDMPTDRTRYADVIDYHTAGFARLATNWNELLRLQAEATVPREFVAFPSYEWHSCEFGDHNVYAPGPELPLHDAPHLSKLRNMVKRFGGIAVPHHIGYKTGYRGIDWRHFQEDISPFVEVFSLHGCSVDEFAPYPMLHDMGPRDSGSTAEAGWQLGHQFGIVGGTDHHAAYPGSHGDGRMGVFAEHLTRESLWEAFLTRRVFAATGDRIDARLFVDDAWIGAVVHQPGARHLRVLVRGVDAVDKVEVLKNGRVLRRLFPRKSASGGRKSPGNTGRLTPTARQQNSVESGDAPHRLRLTWGWGRKREPVTWNAKLSLSDGIIKTVDTCFSGQAIVSPKQVSEVGRRPETEDLPHELIQQNDRSCEWRSITTGNVTNRHAATQALSLQVESPLEAVLTVDVNGRKLQHSLRELLRAGRSHYLRGWLSEAIRVGPLVPLGDCTVEAEFTDEPEQDVDRYRLQVAQYNGQWAWTTPIWCER